MIKGIIPLMQHRSNVLKMICCLGLGIAILTSCNGKGGHSPMADGKEYPVSLTQKDEGMADSSEVIKEIQSENNYSAPAAIAPNRSEKMTTTEPDNMRSFDPASEDDMDDNGLSRYMENNDEEGWD